MLRRRLIIAACWLNLCAINATAETTVIRPGSCASAGTYLLAENSGALIKVTSLATEEVSDHIIVFRDHALSGWASQRLLRRFDLKLSEDGPYIFNTGGFCEMGG